MYYLKNMRYLIIILFFCTINFACKKNSTSSSCDDADINCTGVTCLIQQYLFDFRIVDKITGTDLVFGSSPRYTTGDIKLYADVALTSEIQITADVSSKSFHAIQAKPQMYLVIASTSTYTLSVDFKKIDCCTDRIKNLKSDGQVVCTCCGDIVSIKVN